MQVAEKYFLFGSAKKYVVQEYEKKTGDLTPPFLIPQQNN